MTRNCCSLSPSLRADRTKALTTTSKKNTRNNLIENKLQATDPEITIYSGDYRQSTSKELYQQETHQKIGRLAQIFYLIKNGLWYLAWYLDFIGTQKLEKLERCLMGFARQFWMMYPDCLRYLVWREQAKNHECTLKKFGRQVGAQMESFNQQILRSFWLQKKTTP